MDNSQQVYYYLDVKNGSNDAQLLVLIVRFLGIGVNSLVFLNFGVIALLTAHYAFDLSSEVVRVWCEEGGG